MLINDSPSVEWSKKAYVFNPHARGLVLSEESEENILVNLHGLLGEPDAVQIEIASENLEEGSQFVYDNVAYGPSIHGLARTQADMDRIVEESLQKAGLLEEVKDRLNQPGTGLSGGQQQRLCIARAIAVSPDVILMDEPCSALDPIATARIEELIEELRKNYTIIIVTHSMQQAARVSQQTAFFHLGDLVEVGKTDDLFVKPQQQKTQDYITGRFG